MVNMLEKLIAAANPAPQKPPPKPRIDYNYASLCETCQSLDPINSLRNIPESTGKERLGTVAELQAKQHCSLCRLFLQAYDLGKRGKYTESSKDSTQVEILCVKAISDDSSSSHFALGDGLALEIFGEVHLLQEEEPPRVGDGGLNAMLQLDWEYQGDEGGRDRVVNRNGIDTALVRSWIAECIQDHGQRCNKNASSTPRDQLELDLLLIDVQERRLVDRRVSGDQGVPYIALSYVWGQVQVLQTLCANVAQLKRPGALDSANKAIPRVVHDAMALVEEIGDRYLWVDALCIVQDSPNKADQLQVMDLIYKRARLTIVAMAGQDANCSLPGVSPGTRAAQPVAVVDNQTLFAKLPTIEKEVLSSKHFTRGWTYQEVMLSPRCLFVSPYQVHFRCRSKMFTEDHNGAVQKVHSKMVQLCLPTRVNPLTFPMDYQKYVTAYTSRCLTFDGDIIDAFTAILNHLSAQYQVTFHAAIPTDFAKAFIPAILWCPTTFPTRRSLTNRADPGSNLPSWSWVGWKAPATYSLLEFQVSVRIHGLLLDDTIKIKERGENGFHTIQNRAPSSERCATARPEGKGGCFISLGISSINTEEESQDPKNIGCTPWTCLETVTHLSIIQFQASTLLPDKVRFGNIHTETVRDANKRESLAMRLLPVFDLENRQCGSFLNPSFSTLYSDRLQRMRLIAIGSDEGSGPRLDFERKWLDPQFCAESKDKGNCVCILKVMLIEVHGGVAERVAIGQIHPKAWTAAGPKFQLINLC